MKVRAESLQIGDVIMPPAREVRLWMRRYLAEHNLAESALYLTITSIREAMPDKTGRWLLVTADQSEAWNAGRKNLPFKFKVRPDTDWERIGFVDGLNAKLQGLATSLRRIADNKE